MSQIIVGHFEPDGELIYLPIGFVPDLFRMWDYATAPKGHTWFERMEDDEASGSQEGILDDGDGTYSKAADDGGIAAYDSGSELPTIGEWTASTAYTARSATAHGSYVKATTSGVDANGNEIDRSAIFECVTAGTTGSSEPVWPHVIGENGPSDNGVVWQKVNVAQFRGGYKGVRIAAALMTNGQETYYEAIQADQSLDLGDVDGWTAGVKGA